MWYELLKRKINRTNDENLLSTIEMMYAAHQLTDEQYQELINLMNDKALDGIN